MSWPTGSASQLVDSRGTKDAENLEAEHFEEGWRIEGVFPSRAD